VLRGALIRVCNGAGGEGSRIFVLKVLPEQESASQGADLGMDSEVSCFELAGGKTSHVRALLARGWRVSIGRVPECLDCSGITWVSRLSMSQVLTKEGLGSNYSGH
jgi:hypothetical protein